MPAATLDLNTVYLNFVTTEPAGGGSIVRIVAERETVSKLGGAAFDRLVRGPRLTLAQARMTGLTNAQLEEAEDLDVVLEDLLDFSRGRALWVAPLGGASRDALPAAAYSAGFPRFQIPPLLGIDELASVVLPTVGRRGIEEVIEHYRGIGVPPMSKSDGLHSVK